MMKCMHVIDKHVDIECYKIQQNMPCCFLRSISFLRLLFVVLFSVLVHINNIYLIHHMPSDAQTTASFFVFLGHVGFNFGIVC